MNRRQSIKFAFAFSLWLSALSTSAFYNPTEGRWLSRDPVGEKTTKSLYALVDNDTIESWDINGLHKSIGVHPSSHIHPRPVHQIGARPNSNSAAYTALKNCVGTPAFTFADNHAPGWREINDHDKRCK
jgi:hypothetical protein